MIPTSAIPHQAPISTDTEEFTADKETLPLVTQHHNAATSTTRDPVQVALEGKRGRINTLSRISVANDPLNVNALNDPGETSTAAQNRSSLSRASSTSPQSVPEDIAVSVSGQGIGMSGGKLYTWNAQTDSWHASNTNNIQRVKLGANNDEIWAMDANKLVARVQENGTPQAAGSAALPAGTTDFAVSAGGAKTFIANGAVSILRNGAAAPAPLHPPVDMGSAKSLALTYGGHLHVLSDTGELWTMSSRPPATGGVPNSGDVANPEYWQRLTVNAPVNPATPLEGVLDSALADASRSPTSGLDRLQILRDGSVGAEVHGKLHRLDGGAWVPTTLNAKGAREDFYDSFPSGSSWNKVFLNEINPGFFSFGLPASSPGTAGHGDFQLLKQELNSDMRQLSRLVVTPAKPLDKLDDARRNSINTMIAKPDGTGVDHNAALALTMLEANIDRLPRNTKATKRNNPDHNALQAVLTFRRRILGKSDITAPPDPVSLRIAALLRQDVCLPIDEKKFMIPMGKIVHDHAMLMQAMNEPLKANVDTWDQRIDGVAGDGSTNKVTTLFNSAVVDATQFERTNDASARINSGIQNLNANFVRALREVGNPTPVTIADKAVEFVDSLKPNKESISLNFNSANGFDLEGLWAFFNLNDKTVGASAAPLIGLNKDPILTPLATFSHGTALGFEISRTDTGLKISINDSYETNASAGLRLQLRFGAVTPQADGKVALIAVTGAEGAPIIGGSVGKNRCVTLEFEQDDNGRVQELVHDLYSGQASLDSLLKQADSVTNSQGKTTKLKGEAYAHGFVALRANYGAERDDIQQGLFLGASNLIVPALEQLSGSRELSWTQSASQSTDGSVTKSQNFAAKSQLDFNHVSVFDVSTWISAAIDPSVGSSTQIQWKVPLFLGVWNKRLWSDQVTPAGSSAHFGADGALTGASISFSTIEAPMRSAQQDRPMTAANFPQLAALTADQPGIQRYLDILNENPQLRPTVTMELTPPATNAVLAKIAGLPVGLSAEERRDAITGFTTEALNDPTNLRITSIGVAQSSSAPELGIKAFGPLRRVEFQSHTLSREGSSIVVSYDDGAAAATGFRVTGEPLLGEAVKPNIEQFKSLSKYGSTYLDTLLIPVTNNEAKHVLAANLQRRGRVDATAIAAHQAAIFAPPGPTGINIGAGALAMVNGNLVYRPITAAPHEIVNVPLNIQQQIVGQNPVAILSLMASNASGVINFPATPTQSAAMNELPTYRKPNEQAMIIPLEVSPASALHVSDIIEDCRNAGNAFNEGALSPAQRLVLATFLPPQASENPLPYSIASLGAPGRGGVAYSKDILRTLTQDRKIADVFMANVEAAQREVVRPAV
jgi:hypothetical protein